MMQIDRDGLHTRLDALLDTADADTGAVDAARFWVFASEVARGRGIDTELAAAAAGAIAEHRVSSDPFDLWRAFQGALVFHLTKRLSLPGYEAILPESFDSVAMKAHFLNMVNGRKPLPDLFSRKQGSRAMAALARRLIVGVVAYRAEKEGISEAEARRLLLPEAGHPTDQDREGTGFYRTWRDWKTEAQAEGWVERAQAAARGEAPAEPYERDAQAVAELWHAAK